MCVCVRRSLFSPVDNDVIDVDGSHSYTRWFVFFIIFEGIHGCRCVAGEAPLRTPHDRFTHEYTPREKVRERERDGERASHTHTHETAHACA